MIQKYSYSSYEEFLKIRRRLQGVGKKGIFRLGASDVATVYGTGERSGLNEYTSPTVFFYESCGFTKRDLPATIVMVRGQIQESVIYNNYWKHFPPDCPTQEGFLDNHNGERRTFRKAIKANAIFYNDKYPWLFASPDYIISKNKYTKTGILELKSPSSRANEKYEAGISTAYVIQVHDQMLIMGYNYGELFAVTDATYPEMYQFNKNDGIQKNIIDSTHEFYKKVLAGKKIVYSQMPQLEKEQALAEIAPPDNGDPLYTDYLKDKHKPKNAKQTVPGDGFQLGLVTEYLTQKATIKTESESLLEKENKIREWFTGNIGYIEWPDLGKISWVEKLTIPKTILTKIEHE